MSKTSQRKGRAGEIELVEILCKNGYQVSPGTPLSFGTEPDLVGLPDSHIECKRVERLDLYGAMDQSERDSQRFKDGMPCVFHRKNRKRWLVTMYLEDWMKLYQGRRNHE